MSYKIEFSYEPEFENLMQSLKDKYGQELFEVDGVGSQTDLNTFKKLFFNSSVAVNSSVDPNSNVDDTSVITFNAEFGKPFLRLDSYYTLWKKVKELENDDMAAKIVEAQLRGDIYIHDFHGIASGEAYCFNYSTYDILGFGLPMVKKITSCPPQHLLAFKSQLEQFIIIAANSTLGATGIADLLISMSFYMRKILDTKEDAHFKFASEEDCYIYFKENITSLIYTLNQPMRSNQSPFTNISVYDSYFLESMTEGIIFPDGSKPDVKLIERLQEIFIDTMNEELRRTPLTFPVTTACMTVEDGKIKDREFLRMVAEKNLEFAFINFYFGESSTLSSCCRLRSNTKNEFFNSFGAGSSKIGSLGVVSINFPRLAQQAKSIEEFEERLRYYVRMTGVINNAKREIVKERIESGHLPLYTLGFMELSKQYSTTGVNGFFECLEFLDKSLLSEDGQEYAVHMMQLLNEEIDVLQQKYKAPHNCEQVPGETASIKLCKKDKLLGLDLGLELYSNQFIPLTVPTDMLNRIKIQGLLDKYFSGGSVLHLNIEEVITDVQKVMDLLDYCVKCGVIYTAICYLLNRCKNSHMTVGHRDKCPKCGSEIIGKYQRVVGFLTQVDFWHEVRRRVDFPNRVFYDL